MLLLTYIYLLSAIQPVLIGQYVHQTQQKPQNLSTISNLPLTLKPEQIHDTLESVTLDDLNLVWSENFSVFPGERWVGEQIPFEPETLNGKQYLRQVGNPDAGSHFIAAVSPVHFGAWEFSVRFDGFTTSTQNRVWVWLTVNDPENPHGYAVRLGESGSQKFVRIFRMNGESAPIELLRSTRVMPDSDIDIYVRVERYPNHTWRLGVRSSTESDYDWTSARYEDTVPQGRHWFGFQTSFTATRADRFLFGKVRIWQFPIFVTKIEPLSGTRLLIHFSESIPESLVDILRYGTLVQGYGDDSGLISAISISDTIIEINFSRVLSGGEYSIQLPSFNSPVTGNIYPGDKYPFKIFDEASLFDVVINEFTPRPGTLHFVEILNRSDKLLNLQGWEFGRQTQTRLLSNTDGEIVLLPGEIALLGTIPDNVLAYSTSQHVSLTLPTFGLNQDRLWLRNSQGELIDSISYSSEWVRELTAGISLERIDPDYAGNDMRNWAPSRNSSGNTAGLPNSHDLADTQSLEIISARVILPETVEVVFNRFVNPGEAVLRIDHDLPLWFEWSPWSGDRVLAAFPDQNNWLYQREALLVIDDISIFGSSDSEYLQQPISQPVRSGDIILNEIMYQPLQNRFSPFADQSEYVELQNLKPYRVDLTNLYLSDSMDKNGTFRTWKHISENWYADAGSFAVIFADTSRNWIDTRVHRSFGVTGGSNWARVDRSTLGLTSSGRGVYVRNESEVTIDSIYYSPNWHHPFVRDPRGRSLERILREVIPGSPGWTSSTAKEGGTPGNPNSTELILQDDFPSETGIIVVPNPFSPDNDGRNDQALIRYIPPTIGYLVRIDIFDRQGRLVRNLLADTLAGSDITVLWNGRDNSGRVLATGVYIILIEAYKSDERVIREKKTIVIARASH
jgi:hypothetical protein